MDADKVKRGGDLVCDRAFAASNVRFVSILRATARFVWDGAPDETGLEGRDKVAFAEMLAVFGIQPMS